MSSGLEGPENPLQFVVDHVWTVEDNQWDAVFEIDGERIKVLEPEGFSKEAADALVAKLSEPPYEIACDVVDVTPKRTTIFVELSTVPDL